MSEANYTQIPNDLMDKWLSLLSGPELKVLLYLFRRTRGFHRDRVEIGIRGIADGFVGKDQGTGLSVPAIRTATEALQKRGLLKWSKGCRGRRIYEIVFESDCATPLHSDCETKLHSGEADCVTGLHSDCATPLHTKKERRNKENHHQKESPERKRDSGQKSTVVDSARTPAAVPEPETPVPISSPKADDEKPPAPEPRKTGQTPEQEFLLRFGERHSDKYDSGKALATVKSELMKGSIPLSEFLEADLKTTTNPKGLTNPPGHYRRLAQGLVREQAGKTIQAILERKQQIESPPSLIDPHAGAERCERCGHPKGKGYLFVPGRSMRDAMVPCDCMDLETIERAEERGKVPSDWRSVDRAQLVTEREWLGQGKLPSSVRQMAGAAA